jgi:hypothetical protein
MAQVMQLLSKGLERRAFFTCPTTTFEFKKDVGPSKRFVWLGIQDRPNC